MPRSGPSSINDLRKAHLIAFAINNQFTKADAICRIETARLRLRKETAPVAAPAPPRSAGAQRTLPEEDTFAVIQAPVHKEPEERDIAKAQLHSTSKTILETPWIVQNYKGWFATLWDNWKLGIVGAICWILGTFLKPSVEGYGERAKEFMPGLATNSPAPSLATTPVTNAAASPATSVAGSRDGAVS